MKNNILISGASGFIGSNLVSYLKSENVNFIRLTNSSKLININDFAQVINYGELNSTGIDPNVYIHLAGKVQDSNRFRNQKEFFEVNYELTKLLFDHFLKNPQAKTFIFLSTIHVLTESPEGIVRENYIPKPNTPYGKSKLAAENYIVQNTIPGKSIYILRPTMVHGRGNKGNLNQLVKMVKMGIPYPFGLVNNRRSFLSIGNLNFVISELIDGDIESGIYHLADDHATDTHSLIQMIADKFDKPARIWKIPLFMIKMICYIGEYIPIGLNMSKYRKLTNDFIVDNQKIKLALNKPLPIQANEGMEETLKYLIKE